MKKQKPNNSNDCKLYLDHTPVWAGDGFYCSKCMLEFVPKKFISSEIQKEREKVLEEVREMIKLEGEDPDIKGTFIEDKGTGTVENPVIRNQLRKELLSKINSLKEK